MYEYIGLGVLYRVCLCGLESGLQPGCLYTALITSTVLTLVWLSGNVVGHINKVTVCRAGLVLRWVTVRGYIISVFNQATRANSAWSSLRG